MECVFWLEIVWLVESPDQYDSFQLCSLFLRKLKITIFNFFQPLINFCCWLIGLHLPSLTQTTMIPLIWIYKCSFFCFPSKFCLSPSSTFLKMLRLISHYCTCVLSCSLPFVRLANKDTTSQLHFSSWEVLEWYWHFHAFK